LLYTANPLLIQEHNQEQIHENIQEQIQVVMMTVVTSLDFLG